MSSRAYLRRVVSAIAVAFALVLTVFEWASAGTTGVLRGRVVDAAGNTPLAGVEVTATSPSSASTVRSSTSGDFTFVSLPPDTYVLSATRQGFDPFANSGITVLADQTRDVTLALQKTLKTIGRTTARSSTNIVKPGTTSDVYSINGALQTAASAAAGAGSLDQGYSGLATVPRAYVPQGQEGWNQLVYIRGGDSTDVGVEFDGIPLNRSSDGAPTSTLSVLGQQELQAYTGGVPASSDAQGLSGYINQVVKTGTYPGFANASAGLGGPTFYHKLVGEIGGATRDRHFSYYVGLAGVNQTYRFGDQFNGVSNPLNSTALNVARTAGNAYAGNGAPAFFVPGTTYAPAATFDREAIVNLHVGIPHHANALTDDVQLLYTSSHVFFTNNDSLGDYGSLSSLTGALGYRPVWVDSYVYGGPVFAPPVAAQIRAAPFPNSPSHPFGAFLPSDLRDSGDNGLTVAKLQYQHNIDERSYLRVFGYTDYANWFLSGPVSANLVYGPVLADYEVIGHNYGVNGIYSNQLSDRHALTLTGSYQAQHLHTISNDSPFNGQIVTNLIDASGNCYSPSTGGYASCFSGDGHNVYSQGGVNGASLTPPVLAVDPVTGAATGAASSGARWLVTENGQHSGALDAVTPYISAVSLSDAYRPSRRLTINAGARLENFTFRLAETGGPYPARPFWYAAYNRENCFSPGAYATTSATLDPATGAWTCPTGSAHVALSGSSPKTSSYTIFEPRFGFTYSFTPDTVVRGSYGRYSAPPSSSDQLQGASQQNLASYIGQFVPFGYTTPHHDVHPATSDSFDFSLEQHVPKTDYAFSVTPFLRTTRDQIQATPIGAGGVVAGFNTGRQTSSGVELLIRKGDFARDGVSFNLSYAYTRSRIRFGNLPVGYNYVDTVDSAIQQYNSFTRACASANAALCGTYGAKNALPAFPSAGGPAVTNPYFNNAPQPLFDRNADYVPYTPLSTLSNGFRSTEVPHVATFVLNYKHGRASVTPSLTYSSGASYGAPFSTVGFDPTTCAPGATGAVTPASCSGFVFVPNTYTHRFDGFGDFKDPSRLTVNLQTSYQFSTRVRLTLTGTSLIDRCYQRGYAWDNGTTCQYAQLPLNLLSATSNATGGPVQLAYPYGSWYNNFWNGTVGQKIPTAVFGTLDVKL